MSAADIYRPMIAAAVKGSENLSAAEKSDVFEGIAHLARRWDSTLSRDAKTLASALRDSEALQLHFHNLFSAE